MSRAGVPTVAYAVITDSDAEEFGQGRRAALPLENPFRAGREWPADTHPALADDRAFEQMYARQGARRWAHLGWLDEDDHHRPHSTIATTAPARARPT